MKLVLSEPCNYSTHKVLTVSFSDDEFVIGPCRSQRPMTMTENEKGQEGPGTIIISSREEEPEPKTYLGNARVSTLFQEGQVTDAGCH